MIRATLYLLVSAAVWGAEGYVFSRFLAFSLGQSVLLGLVYLTLFVVALGLLLRFQRGYQPEAGDLAHWRLLSLAPMMVAVIGSFVSLPVLLVVAALGKIL